MGNLLCTDVSVDDTSLEVFSEFPLREVIPVDLWKISLRGASRILSRTNCVLCRTLEVPARPFWAY